MDTIELFTLKEIAKILKVTKASMYNYIDAGMPTYSVNPIRFLLPDVLEWVQNRERKELIRKGLQ